MDKRIKTVDSVLKELSSYHLEDEIIILTANENISQAKSELLKLIKEKIPKRKDIKDNFRDDPYCKSCRLSETFCQCEGFNKAIDKVNKGIDELFK